MKPEAIAVSRRLCSALRLALDECKIVFLSAGAGWGKTTAVRECLNGRDAVYSAVEGGRVPRLCAKADLVVLDDFHALPPRLEKRMGEILRRSPKRQRLILLSRGAPPDFLLPYQYSGELRLLTQEDLALTEEEIVRLANARGMALSGDDLCRLRQATGGCPLHLRFLLDRISALGPGPQAAEAARRRLYDYLDETLFFAWDRPTRRVLLSGLYFPAVTSSLVRAAMDGADGEALLERIARQTGLLAAEPGDIWRYTDPVLAVPYLRWKAQRELDERELCRLHALSAAWCQERGDHPEAARHYAAARDRPRMRQALVQTIQQDGRAWTLCRLADCLDELSESEILSAPELIYARSRLAGLRLQPEQAARWCGALRARAAGPDQAAARALLFRLELLLPTGDAETARRPAAPAPGHEADPLPLTAGFPSILRGERDLSGQMAGAGSVGELPAWPAIARAAGDRADNLAELLWIEYRLEQGEPVRASLLQREPLQLRLRAQGALDLEFVCVALTTRSLCAEGQFPEAASYLMRFRQRAEAAGAAELLANIDAARCRIALLEDSLYASNWLAAQPPTGGAFSLPDGYCLLTRVRCHIKRGEYQTALLFLGRVLAGYARGGRVLGQMEALILAAICGYRMGDAGWREQLGRALVLGAGCGYAAVFAREGAAVLPLLERCKPASELPARYWGRVLHKTIGQAARSPGYLQPIGGLSEPLTSTERTVLSLLTRRMTSEEIGRALGVQTSTVRTHLRHIFAKLGVHNREEARRAALRLNLV